jgi:hypothetical protein
MVDAGQARRVQRSQRAGLVRGRLTDVAVVVACGRSHHAGRSAAPRMDNLLHPLASVPFDRRLVYAAVGILLIHAAFRLLERTLPDRFHEQDARYRVRKFIALSGYVTVIFFVAVVFEDGLGNVTVALGVAGAGLVIALQDLIASFAGWIAIGVSSLYSVGHRVQIGEMKGDVIDISIMRTTLMETGSGVSGDLYTGRVLRIPNHCILKGPIFNYSQGFRFVWDEIRIVLTATSDHRLARELISRVAREQLGGYLTEARRSWKKIVDNYRLEHPPLEPTVTMIVSGGSLEFILSYVVDYAHRTAMQDALFTQIAEHISQSDGSLAWSSSGGGYRAVRQVAGASS